MSDKLTMVLRLLAVLVGTILSAALLTPIVYTAASAAGVLPSWPFSRVFDRVILVAALVWIIYLRSGIHLRQYADFFRRGTWRNRLTVMGIGLLLSFTVSLLVLPLILFSNQIAFAVRTPWYYLGKFFREVPGALLISVAEESFFRMFFFGSLRRKYSFGVAAALSSLAYSFVHFVKPQKDFLYTTFDPLAGLRYLETVLTHMFAAELLPPFLGLLLVGCALCYAFNRWQNIYLCIGLHSGWVLIEKLSKHATAFTSPEQVSILASRFFLVGYPALWLGVGLVAVALAVLSKSSRFNSLCSGGDRVNAA